MSEQDDRQESGGDPESASGPESAPEPESTSEPASAADGASEATSQRADEEEATAADSEDLSEEIQEALEELEELRDRHLRLAAEFENYRKRTRKELRDSRERAQAALAGRLLEALDDMNRLLEADEEAATAEALREGVEMVRRKLTKELSEAGLDRMEPEGERFDPEYHDALLTTPVDDPEEDQTISRVLIDGYTFGDRVLRPARVEVKKYRADDAAGDAEPEEGETRDGDGDGPEAETGGAPQG